MEAKRGGMILSNLLADLVASEFLVQAIGEGVK